MKVRGILNIISVIVLLSYQILYIFSQVAISATNIKYWDFSDPVNYTFSDATKIHIANGKAKLTPLYQLISTINNGDGGALLDGSFRTTVTGNIAYVGAYRSDALNIIDISNIVNPTVIKVIQDGDIDPVTNQTIYLNGISDMVITGNYLYVAAYVSDRLQIFDITDPANPIAVNSIRRSTAFKFNGIKGLFITGNYLYVVSSVDDSFQILDISNPVNPTPLGFYQDGTLLNSAGSVWGTGNYAFITAERGDSIAIFDISDPNNIVLVSSLTNDATNGPFLDAAYDVVEIENKLYVTAFNSDALNLIDVTDPNNPLFITGLINNNSNIRLNSARQLFLDSTDKDYIHVASRVSDSLQAFDISSTGEIVPLTILRDSTVLNGALGLYMSGNLIFLNSYNADNWSIIKRYYDSTNPYIQPTQPWNYAGKIYSFQEVLGPHNEGIIKYQISNDGGNTWYWRNGSAWVQTTDLTATETNTASEINLNIASFNDISGTYQFSFRAFFISDGQQEVELDRIIVKADPIPPEIPNKILHLDTENIDADGYNFNEPLSGDTVPLWKDLTPNGHNAYETAAGNGAIYNTGGINNKPALWFDGTKWYEIANATDINTNAAGYPTRTIGIVFKTSDDITTRQFIYEEGGAVNGWGIMIKNGRLYAGGWSESNWMNEEKWQGIDLGPIAPNTTYSVLIIHNGTNNDWQQNYQQVYLNGNLVSSKNFITKLNAHSGKIGIGGINIHTIDLETNADVTLSNGENFKGWIGELIMRNSVLSSGYIQNLNNYWKTKWGIDYLNHPQINLPFSNRNAIYTGLQNITFSYTDNIGIDTTSADIQLKKRGGAAWDIDMNVNIISSNITTTGATYQIDFDEEGLYKITFSIANLSGYRATKEVVFFVNPWAIAFPIFHRDGQNIDGDRDPTNEPADGTTIDWLSDIYFIHPATQATAANQPSYHSSGINTHPALYFDGTNDWLNVDNHRKINTTTSTYKEKSFAIVFKTSGDVNSKQIIYEQGAGARGYALMIENGYLYAGVWNNIEWPTTNWLKYINLGAISPYSTYYVIFSHNATNTDSSLNTFKAWLNSNLVDTLTGLSPQYPHGGLIGLGWMRGGMVDYLGNQLNGNGYNFKGWLGEIISFNKALSNTDALNIFNYFQARWAPPDITPPFIQSIFPISGQILPIGNLNIKISYIDTGSGIDPSSANIILEKRNTNLNIWQDITSTGLTANTITTTGAIYDLNNLSYGKYRYSFSISDYKSNQSTTGAIFYVDSPSFQISSGNINIGTLTTGGITFSTDITITVQTIGAPFEINIFKQSNLTFDTYQIIDWNGTTGWGYDKSPYDNILEPLYTGGILIYTGGGNINTDGNLNTYTYILRLGALVDENQIAGIYNANIGFTVKFSY